MNNVYVKSAGVVFGDEPDYKAFLSPMQSRRMGTLLKRALVCSLQVMKAGGVMLPDAIVCGTALGCMRNTELFMEKHTPTPFMQSTHNTVSSLIAIHTHCHGYNSTYSQGRLSFASALLDAFLQIRAGEIHTALVGAHDEATDNTLALLPSTWRPAEGYDFTEGSASLILTDSPDWALCRISDIRISRISISDTRISDITTGLNTMSSDDDEYDYMTHFGDGFASSGMGTCEAARLIGEGKISSARIVAREGEYAAKIVLQRE